MSEAFDPVAFLRAKADEYENTGHGQFSRSANHLTDGYTEFNNALIWGRRAQVFREAAVELERELKRHD